ncbi:MAG: hypothetical protein HW387_908 [Parachlamydiales bacterium]|nr:hypothetical protein [Parachlamydiales bacterium]
MRKRNINHRPKHIQAVKPIDWAVVDRLLKCGSTGVEVAARLGIHPDTLYERTEKERRTGFTAYAAEKRANGNTLLREAQFYAAIQDRDRTMLIWLGKQNLGQKEPEPRSVEACKPALLAYLEGLVKG